MFARVVTVLDELAAYLRTEAARPFALGSADCATLAADWVQLRHGADPLTDFRGSYADGFDWSRLTRVAGRTLRRMGLRLTRDPGPGDVGVIALGEAAAVAIRTGRGWVVRDNSGLLGVQAEDVRVIAAWRV